MQLKKNYSDGFIFKSLFFLENVNLGLYELKILFVMSNYFFQIEHLIEFSSCFTK